jgi:hypothetical protein
MYLVYKISNGELVSGYYKKSIRDERLTELGSGYAGVEKNNYNPDTDRYYNASTDTFSGPTDVEADAELVQKIRNDRTEMLRASDWTQLPDSPLTDTKKQEWATYRQQLRDMPTTDNPANPTWPSKPS